MHSLRSRLWVLWTLALGASVAVGLLLVQLYRTSTTAQAGQAEAVVARSCDAIRDRYAFYVTGWNGIDGRAGPQFGHDLVSVVFAALAPQAGVEGGVWSATRGSLAYAFPTYEGTGPKTDLPVAELGNIRAVNREAASADQETLRRSSSRTESLLLAACPLSGPIGGLTAWAMTRVQAVRGYDQMRLGLGLLFALVLVIAGWVTRLTMLWGRHLRAIETALAAHDIEDLPALATTGERELDRLVTALNEAGARLSQARLRAAELAGRVASAERLAALGRVAAGVAHEIRNPMAAMRLRIENALAGDPARQRPALEASLEQVGRVDGLVSELLAMTHRRTPEWQDVDLRNFLDHRIEAHRDEAERAGATLSVDCRPDTARFDPELIARLLDNLLLNAIRHTPKGGEVRLRAGSDADSVRITVDDAGPGIDPQLRDRLFEPFATGRPDGTGLGLAIARELAEAHGGRLALADQVCGRGAAFILELPRSAPCPPS